MSLLTRSVFRSRTSPLRIFAASKQSFHVSTARAALSESDHSKRGFRSSSFVLNFINENDDSVLKFFFGGLDDDTRKKVIDEHKTDQLEKQKEGKGHWKGELSSNSESAVMRQIWKKKSVGNMILISYFRNKG